MSTAFVFACTVATEAWGINPVCKRFRYTVALPLPSMCAAPANQSTGVDPASGPGRLDADWWRSAVVYQVYPRSFADSDGDGVGDLAGVTSRLDYLAALGIDAIWLSPFYPSALADGGYDVDDHRDVDPLLGTLDDFDRLIGRAHEAGIRVIVDIVPNHSSDRHTFFREALATPAGSAARGRYVFRDGLGPDRVVPPSPWQSLFGGPAWQAVGDGQFYLHLFAPEQPDFDWSHPDVHAEFARTLRFWADRGVDGFRIDVAHGLAKNLTEPLPDVPVIEDQLRSDGSHPLWDRDAVHDIYAEWRQVFDEYDPPRMAVAEAWVHPDRRGRYASSDGLGQTFNFDLLEAPFDAARFREVIDHNLADAGRTGSSNTWVLSNHDVVRHATRYGLPSARTEPSHGARRWLLTVGTAPPLVRATGLSRARAATMLLLALPGSVYLYQGEELGLHEVADIPDADRQDPTFARKRGEDVGRDGCRVPLPWTRAGESFGFGSGRAHLPQPAWFGGDSVEAEQVDQASTLVLYRRLLALRRGLQDDGPLLWLDAPPTVLHLRRASGWESVTNFGEEAVSLPAGRMIAASGPVDRDRLPPATTVWLLPVEG